MKKLIRQIISGNGSRSEGVPVSINPDELIEFAQNHFKKDFPNRERLECPRASLLSELVATLKFPDEATRSHLFTCSECFALYRNELAMRNETAPLAVRVRSQRLFIPRLVPAFAVFIIVIIPTVALLLMLSYRRSGESGTARNVAGAANPIAQSTQIAPTKQPPANAKPTQHGNIENEAESATVRRTSGERAKHNLLATNTVKIDLQAYDSLRGANQDIKPMTLKAGVNRLVIRLPDGSPGGRYTVKLADAFGNAMDSAWAFSKDGHNIRVTLDLSHVRTAGHMLCIAHGDELPDCLSTSVIR